jgi:hypothetical protein
VSSDRVGGQFKPAAAPASCPTVSSSTPPSRLSLATSALAVAKVRPSGALDAHGATSAPASASTSATAPPATHAPPRKAEEAAATRLMGSLPTCWVTPRLARSGPSAADLALSLSSTGTTTPTYERSATASAAAAATYRKGASASRPPPGG